MKPHLVCPDCLGVTKANAEDCDECGFVRPNSGWQVDPLVGLILDGRYRLEGRLGAGGMATVFRASRVGRLGGNVAVKVLAPRFARTVVAKRFQREAEVVSQLTNPHIVRIYDYHSFTLTGPGGDERELFFIAMELIDGDTLHEAIVARGADVSDFAWGIDILRQTARGLDEAHQAGITHRDLKPSNIMLVQARDATHVKILDFGIAALTRREGEPAEKLTRTGFISGTPDYMAPEQAIGDAALGPAADMYALGVIAYELFTGRLPFEGKTALDKLMKRVSTPAPSLRDAVNDPRMPKAIFHIVDRLLSRQPNDRYQDAGELLDDLARFPAFHTSPAFRSPSKLREAYERGTPAADPGAAKASSERTLPANTVASLGPAPRAAAKPKGKSPLLWLLGALAIVGVGFAATLMITGSGSNDTKPADANQQPAAADASEQRHAAEPKDVALGTVEADMTPSPAGDATLAAAVTDTTADTLAVATALLGHPRPPLEPAYVVATTMALDELSVGLALPRARPASYKPLPLRVTIDSKSGPLRVASLHATVVTMPDAELVGHATGRARPQDGRGVVELPPMLLPVAHRITLQGKLADGASFRTDVTYDGSTGTLASP